MNTRPLATPAKPEQLPSLLTILSTFPQRNPHPVQDRTKVLLLVFALTLPRNLSRYPLTPTPIALRHFPLKSLKNSRAETHQNRNPRLPPIQINPAALTPNHSTLNSCPCPITQFLKIPKPLYPCRYRPAPKTPLSSPAPLGFP